MAIEKAQQLLARLIALDDFIGDVRTVEAGGENLGAIERQPLDDIVAGVRVGCCRQRDAGHAREKLGKPAKIPIFRPEIMAPLGDAMRLVDCEKRDLGPAGHLAETLRHDTFRRHIEQIELACGNGTIDIARLLARQR